LPKQNCPKKPARSSVRPVSYRTTAIVAVLEPLIADAFRVTFGRGKKALTLSHIEALAVELPFTRTPLLTYGPADPLLRTMREIAARHGLGKLQTGGVR